MSIDRLATGDNWHEPYISGHDVVYDMISDDIDVNRSNYEDWEIDIMEIDASCMTPVQRNVLLEYIESWYSSRLQTVSY